MTALRPVVIDLATYRRTGRIVERLPIQHTSFTLGADNRPQEIADAFKAFARAMAGALPPSEDRTPCA